MGMSFYTIDTSYIEKLYNTDSEVYFSKKNYDNKPYVGVIIANGAYNYFIPLTSAKAKHLKLPNVSKGHYIVYEAVSMQEIHKEWIYSPMGNGYVRHILGMLDIRKMVPAPMSKCTRIEFSQITDPAYKALLLKEYNFLRPLFAEITRKANAVYTAQKTSGKVFPFYCNFTKLEKICDSESAVTNS